MTSITCYRCGTWTGSGCACSDGQTVILGDCREVLPLISRCDVLLTDPPYGLGDKWGDGRIRWSSPGIKGHGRLWQGMPAWDASICEEGISTAIDKCGQSIVWGGNYYNLPPTNAWLLWDKMQKHTGSEAEMAWSNLDQPVRIFRMSRVEAYCGNEYKQHPNQKPVALIKWAMAFTAGETILDPFAGSFTTARAAKDLGRKSICIELEERYCEIGCRRLEQGVLDFEGATA